MTEHISIQVLEVLAEAIDRLETTHVDDYIKEDNFDVLFGIYVAIDSINNTLQCEFGGTEVSDALGISRLDDKLETALYGKNK